MKKLVNNLKKRYTEQENILLNLEAKKAEAKKELKASEAAFAESENSMVALQSQIVDQITEELQKTFPFFGKTQGLKPLPETLPQLEDELADFGDYDSVLVITDSSGKASMLIGRIDWGDSHQTFKDLNGGWLDYRGLKDYGTHYFTINT